jgi:predicted RNA-binding protein with PUA-like domain
VKRWLVKTEPRAFSFDHFEAEGRTRWDGVTNALAQRHIGAMRTGDSVLVYHTGAEKAVVGIAHVVKGPYPDPKRKDRKLLVVDLAPARRFPRPVTLAEIKTSAAFAGFDLIRLPRLSVVPVGAAEWKALEALARTRHE